MTAGSPCLNAPRRSLAELRLELIARRLEIIRQQLEAPSRGALLAAELADVERRLRAIEEARK